jgi:hypothetical protein
MQERGIAPFTHDAAKRGYQLGPCRAQFVVMMQRQFAEHLLAFGREPKQNFAAVVLGAGAVDKSSRLQAVDQFHGAVVADLHAIGEFSDAWTDSGRHALDRQHELVLAALHAGIFHHLLAEVEEASDLIPELRQCLIVRQGKLLHAADCIVPRSSDIS